VARFSDPEPLGPDHILDGFDCGRASLNIWLIRYARQAAAVGSARAYVMGDSEQERVVGYYALTAAEIQREAATTRAIRGMPQYPIPVVLLARLAVDVSVACRGLGAWLLRDAMMRTLAASETIGVWAMVVHAIDEEARGFYLRNGLEPSPTDPLHLMILIKDIAKSLHAATEADERGEPTCPRGAGRTSAALGCSC
jgi:GNAT superfamily N-acetyltransferase